VALTTTRHSRSVAAIALAAALVLAGCGSLTETAPPPQEAQGAAQPGSLAESVRLQGQTYNVGGKEFDEQLVLCQIAIASLQSVGATANDSCGIVGTQPTRNALLGGDIDLYWEYTGTAWITFFGESRPITDPQQQFDAVAERDLRENQVHWLEPPTPFNNTYAFAVASDKARELGVETLSDLAELTRTNPAEATFCTEAEFSARADGLPGMLQAYQFEIPQGQLATLETGAIYQATANGDPCNFGLVFITDGRIPALNLTVLEDDKKFFPLYNAAVTVRGPAFDRNPAIAEVFAPVQEALTNEVMQELNRQVSEDRVPAREVARTWLQQEGFIGAGS